MIFDGRNGLRYDTAIHDHIDENGNLASAESVAEAWKMPVEEVEAERQERQAGQQGEKQG